MVPNAQYQISRIIPGFDLLRFPLIVGVVMIHCNYLQYLDPPLSGPDTSVFVLFHTIFKRYILDLCVPAFFVISGYLFFREGARMSWSGYKAKLKRRVKTLLVPYLMWNFIGFILFLIKHRPMDIDIIRLLTGFICRLPGDPFPYDFPMWFIRNLIIIDICSPLISVMQCLLKGATPLVPFILCVSVPVFSPGIDPLVVLPNSLYFTLGATLACFGHKLLAARSWPAASVGYLAGCTACISGIGDTSPFIADTLYLITSIFGVLSILLLGIIVADGGRRQIPRFLAGSTFFLYGFHGLFCVITCKTVTKMIRPVNNSLCFTDYFLIFLIIFTISILVYAVLRRLSPGFMALLTGARSRSSASHV